MKIHVLAAAIGAALALPIPALAADGQSGAGHYEWRSVPQYGPRSTGPTQKRVWVRDDAQMTDCHCEMMKISAADCMKAMPGMHGSSSAG